MALEETDRIIKINLKKWYAIFFLFLLSPLVFLIFSNYIRIIPVSIDFYTHKAAYNKALSEVSELMKDGCVWNSPWAESLDDKISSVKNPANISQEIYVDCLYGTTIIFPKIFNIGAGSGEGCVSGVVWSNISSPHVPGSLTTDARLFPLGGEWYAFSYWYPGKC